MSRYSGLVQAKTTCHFGGVKYGPKAVFEVLDQPLWDDDPFYPCEFVRFEAEPLAGAGNHVRQVAIYRRLDIPVYSARSRLQPSDLPHPGLRADAYTGPMQGVEGLREDLVWPPVR